MQLDFVEAAAEGQDAAGAAKEKGPVVAGMAGAEALACGGEPLTCRFICPPRV